MLEFRQCVSRRRARDLDLFRSIRVGHFNHEHEAVELRLGKRVSPLLFDRVLRRENKKRLAQSVRVPRRRYTVFLHRFEHRRLRLRRSPIDFIREHDIGEHWSFDKLELPPATGLLQDVGPP